jgi:hypothetical protein
MAVMEEVILVALIQAQTVVEEIQVVMVKRIYETMDLAV